MNYVEISKNTMSCIYKSYESLNESPLDKGLRSLIELRISQIAAFIVAIYILQMLERIMCLKRS